MGVPTQRNRSTENIHSAVTVVVDLYDYISSTVCKENKMILKRFNDSLENNFLSFFLIRKLIILTLVEWGLPLMREVLRQVPPPPQAGIFLLAFPHYNLADHRVAKGA